MSESLSETRRPEKQEPSAISVLLVDDHAIWCGGMRSMLEDTEFEVIGEAASGREAIEKARELRPQLVLLDIRMADGDGLDTLQGLKAEHPTMSIVMLTTYDNPTYVAGGGRLRLSAQRR